MYERILTALAVFGQFLAMFPFVVTAESVGFGEYVPWHYFALYGVLAVFYCCGRLLSCWANGGGFSRRVKPFVMFLSRIGFIVPTVAFCVIGAIIGAHTGLYMYFLPGCIMEYFAGYLAVGKGYSEIFTRGWFAVFFVASVLAAVLTGFTNDKYIISVGMTQLCIAFGVMMITAAILTNQTNIDTQTRQRAGGNSVLPKGVRSYNALLITGAGALVVGMCLFAKPLAGAVMTLIKLLIRWLLSAFHGSEDTEPDDGGMDENTAEQMDYFQGTNAFAQLFIYALVIGMIILAVKFRRQIWEFIKDIFAPLFKVNVQEQSQPFIDEFSSSTDLRQRSRDNARNEKDLLKKYRRETDPVLKFRKGYELFLMKLGRSAFPQLPTDTTTAHRSKGGMAFGARISEQHIGEMVRQYDRVRYGGKIPDSEALEQLDRLLNEIRERIGDIT